LSRGEGTARIASPRAVAPPLQGVELGSVEAEQVALKALRKKQKAKVMIQIGKRKAKKLRQRRQTAAALEVAAAGEASDEYSSAY
jgi:hypothetical protein